MKTTSKNIFAFLVLFFLLSQFTFALPERDTRGDQIIDLNTPRKFPEIKNLAQWKKRAEEIRTQVLVSAGLYPMSERPPLKATIFGRKEYGDFSVEKVYIETLPGFYLCGNLYRPVGKGNGPFPAILNPHGHWSAGRLEDTENGSIPARCISFARMGMIAFAYDMVGYNDTVFKGVEKEKGYSYHRTFGTNYTDQLWGISLMGLQTWNSIRALDFLVSLPDVDKTRLGCTGASGGGTQTFILGAVDDRLAVLAPTVMVSHSMQGGCSCENMPLLRIEYSNMEIAAVPAPKPQIFMAATGDWTKTFMTVEGPAIAGIYNLFKARDRIYYEVLPFGHNYNKTTREAVYGWFERWLLGKEKGPYYKEQPYPPATNLDLRVFPDNKFPSNLATQDEVREYLKNTVITRFESLVPKTMVELLNFKKTMLPAWRHTIQALWNESDVESVISKTEKSDSYTRKDFYIGVKGRGDRIPLSIFEPAKMKNRILVILASPEGKKRFLQDSAEPSGLAKELLRKGYAVMLIDTFGTGELAEIKTAAKRNYFANFFTTYNRTDFQERTGDIIVAAQFGRSSGYKIIICGVDRAGLLGLFAAPVADIIVADAAQFNCDNDQNLLKQDTFLPCIRCMGGYEGAAILAAPNPILIHNTGNVFRTATLRKVYNSLNKDTNLKIYTDRLSDREITEWIDSVNKTRM